jgi:glycosyltransferase involved in cell wall biosynthesis
MEKINMSPKVSIIVCAYNVEDYISEALDGIYKQSFCDYELIVVDDGSTDKTEEIIKQYQDRGLIHIRNQQNLGLIASMRSGLEVSHGEYISKIDADDIPLPELIEYQVKLLDASSDIGIVGTGYININASGEILDTSGRESDNLFIQWGVMFGQPITNTGVLFRKELLERFSLDYREEFIHAEDYDLWARLLNYCKGSNLSQKLLKKRCHSSNISSRFSHIQFENHLRIAVRTIRERYPDIDISTKEMANLILLKRKNEFPVTNEPADLINTLETYLRLLSSFMNTYQGESLVGYLIVIEILMVYRKLIKKGFIFDLPFHFHIKASKLLFQGFLKYYLTREFFARKMK